MSWLAQRMPLGFATPVYAAALESLMTAWFKSSSSKSRGVYMAKSDFDDLVGDDLERIKSGKLDEVEFGDRIARRMSSSFNLGVNERFLFFFEEIGLEVGVGETTVIRARNRAAHGSAVAAEAQRQLFVDRGYGTLLNRVLLKLLGHKGTYTDYSVAGHPERSLEIPIGLKKA